MCILVLQVKWAKLRGTPGSPPEKLSEAEREVNEAETRLRDSKIAYEVRLLLRLRLCPVVSRRVLATVCVARSISLFAPWQSLQAAAHSGGCKRRPCVCLVCRSWLLP